MYNTLFKYYSMSYKFLNKCEAAEDYFVY
uniref:Uncharacterized protein n=1 Tax=Anguilla anguilla TaxID=7936 RepID=A0A0E9TC28_ANGAN